MSNDVISNVNATPGVFGDLRPVLVRGVSAAGLAENFSVQPDGSLNINDNTDVDASYVFNRTNNTVASTVTVQRTVSGVTKTRTLTYNSAGELLSISAFV